MLQQLLKYRFTYPFLPCLFISWLAGYDGIIIFSKLGHNKTVWFRIIAAPSPYVKFFHGNISWRWSVDNNTPISFQKDWLKCKRYTCWFIVYWQRCSVHDFVNFACGEIVQTIIDPQFYDQEVLSRLDRTGYQPFCLASFVCADIWMEMGLRFLLRSIRKIVNCSTYEYRVSGTGSVNLKLIHSNFYHTLLSTLWLHNGWNQE